MRVQQNLLEILLLGPISTISDPVGPGWGLKSAFLTSLHEPDVADQKPHFENLISEAMFPHLQNEDIISPRPTSQSC